MTAESETSAPGHASSVDDPPRWGPAAPPVPSAPLARDGSGPGRRAPGPLRRILVPAAALAGVVAAFAYVADVDPNEPGHYPACPLLRFTGVFCPGCGGLRSAHAFAHGDLLAALQANAMAVAGYGLFAVVWVIWMVRAARGIPWDPMLSRRQLWALGTVALVFTVVRNLPFGGWLHP